MKEKFVVLFFLFTACYSVDNQKKTEPEGFMSNYSFLLDTMGADTFFLRGFVKKSQKNLTPAFIPWAVYRFEVGNVNGDSFPDILLGVTKKTQFDSILRNRLFIYQARNETIVPLWLGSRLQHPIVDFSVIQGKERDTIRALLLLSDGGFEVCDYVYGSFGLSFVQKKLNLNNKEQGLKILFPD